MPLGVRVGPSATRAAYAGAQELAIPTNLSQFLGDPDDNQHPAGGLGEERDAALLGVMSGGPYEAYDALLFVEMPGIHH